MNFTIVASIISLILLSWFLLNINPPLIVLDYTSLEKIEALDYIAVVNALVYAQNGGSFSQFLRREVNCSFTIKELVVKSDCKKATVLFNHEFTVVNITVYLKIELIQELIQYTPSGELNILIVKAYSDRPVEFKGGDLLNSNGSCFILKTRGIISDNRGLVVKVKIGR